MRVRPTEDCGECDGSGLVWSDWSGAVECSKCDGCGQLRARDSRGRWLPDVERPDEEDEEETAL